jgi:predicted RNase H-like HicB family nuclease
MEVHGRSLLGYLGLDCLVYICRRAIFFAIFRIHAKYFFTNTAFVMNIQIVLERGDDGFFVAHAPALKSCWSQGKTREEALQNIREAIELYLEPDEAIAVAANAELYELTL